MTKRSLAHTQVEWTKQRLDEIDATLVKAEEIVEKTTGAARTEADKALARLKAARAGFATRAKALQDDVAATRDVAEGVYSALAAEWAEFEMSFQNYLTAFTAQRDAVIAVISARADAQRKSWDASMDTMRAQTSNVIEHAQGEFDASIARLTDAREKAEEKLGKASTAGDETWKAIKDGIEETEAAHERMWKKVAAAFTKPS